MEVNLYNDFNIDSEHGGIISVCGACGSGKSKLMVDFAIKHSLSGVDCVYFSEDESASHMRTKFGRALNQRGLTKENLKGRVLLKNSYNMTIKDIFNFIQSNKCKAVFIDSITTITLEKIINPQKRFLITEKTIIKKKIERPVTEFERNRQLVESLRIISSENNLNTFISYNANRNIINKSFPTFDRSRSEFLMISDLAFLISKEYEENEYDIAGGSVTVEKNRWGADGNGTKFKIEY